MIQKLVALALKMRAIVGVLALVILVAGLYCYENLDIEAYPNPVAPMIELITQPNGWSAEEVERYVTVKLEIGLSGMLHLDHVRSESLFGLSDVKCYFTWDIPYKDARQEVLNRLQFIQLPAALQPQLSPWNAIGEIFRYRVVGKGYSLTELKTAEDWILEKQFRQVPGVIDVVGFGGLTKEYHVEVDPYELRGQHLSLKQLIDALGNANQNVGGQRITLGEQSFDVRGVGLIKSLADIGNVVVGETNGVPVRVREIAHVTVGHSPRLGIVGKDLEPDIVQGVVLMRYGGDTLTTIKGVHARVDYIRKYHLLPPGMDIVPYYDRSALVKLTTHTVIENLLVGMLLVTVMLWLFLGHARAALITAVNIPLALMIAFIGMVTTGTPANLISLGAVDFGIVVDSTVIMVENIFRHLGPDGRGTIAERILEAAKGVAPSMLFSTLIIGTAFIPLFTLTGVAGVIFSPMAHTYAFAIGGAMLLAVTLTPVLASRGLRVMTDGHEEANWLMRALNRFYLPLFGFAIRRKRTAVLLAAVPVIGIFALSSAMGREFMPKLEEGNFWIRATLPTSVSLAQAAQYVGRMRAIILGCPGAAEGDADVSKCDERRRTHPELTTVVSQLGRPDDGTDVSGFYNIELFAPLKPNDEWRHGVTKASMTRELSKDLGTAFPGVIFNFSQAISDNVEEAMSGVKGENTVKVVGPDLHVNEGLAQKIENVLGTVPGIEDLGMFHSLGQPSVLITPDRIQCGRYGLNVGDVEEMVQGAIGGQTVTEVYEGEQAFDLTVRWMPAFRDDLEAMRNVLIATPDGRQVPLGQLAQVAINEGPSVVYREDVRRYTPVKFSVRGRDLASTIKEAQAKVGAGVKLPYDTHLEWGGEINQLNETTGRLALIIPLTLMLIAFLVFSSVKNWKDMVVVLAGIPCACSGGVVALLVTQTTFSISAAMGFISIFGVAIQDALIVVPYAQRLWNDGVPLEAGAMQAAERGLRPVLMTTFVAMIGLLPAALSHGIGSETQKPLAIVVIGGALMLAVLPRLLQPALMVLLHGGESRFGRGAPSPGT
jgi:cobalt-zinc-cadmium resistance protein CzcA